MVKKRHQLSTIDHASEHPGDDAHAVHDEGVSASTGDLTDSGSPEEPGAVATGADGSDAEAGGAALRAADRVVRDAAVASVSGNHVEIGDSAVLTLTAGSVEASDTLIVVGTVGKLGGNARVLIDMRAALAFAVVTGLVFAVAVRLISGGGADRE